MLCCQLERGEVGSGEDGAMNVELASSLRGPLMEAEGNGQRRFGRQKGARIDVAKWACFQLGGELGTNQRGEA